RITSTSKQSVILILALRLFQRTRLPTIRLCLPTGELGSTVAPPVFPPTGMCTAAAGARIGEGAELLGFPNLLGTARVTPFSLPPVTRFAAAHKSLVKTNCFMSNTSGVKMGKAPDRPTCGGTMVATQRVG